MLISKRSVYALRVLIDMAENGGINNFITTKELSEREDISKKYLESIMTILSKNKLVDTSLGKGGGYKLNRELYEYRVLDILRVTEEDLSVVDFLKDDADPKEKNANLRLVPLFEELNKDIIKYFKNKTLADLVNIGIDNYVI